MSIPQDELERFEVVGTILVLHWRDGHRGELPLAAVRDHCPCAICRAEVPRRKGRLKMAAPSAASDPAAIVPVGRYALQFHWRDGHGDGIYSFDLLRSICQCPECV